MARVLVVLFAFAIIGAAILVGSYVIGDGTPLFGGLIGQLADPLAPANRDDTRLQIFTVQPGQSAQQIGEELQRRGLVRFSLAFRTEVDRQGVGSRIAAGDYELSPSMSTTDIVRILGSGQVRHGPTATLPEGWRAEQIADRLAEKGVTSRDEFLRAVASPASVPGVEILAPQVPLTLEGYLFPWTYEVRQQVPGNEAAGLMLRTWDQKVGERLRRGAAESSPHLTVQQILTLASIVEREAQLPSERPTIASVYLNRLAREMPLQADPTVQYAVASRDGPAAAAYGYWKRDLSTADLALPSPYNTYLHPGLPPGPICNPGEASIDAVLQPAKTDYLYFVAKGDGSHLFARTLDEHNTNVAKAGQ